ncbi:UDP-4-amino-4,6-dideoxy-N-acetyl-beta-L-altrosamine N-acetyltransferase [Cognatiyoonia sp. IB215446]|uniref:UDP-4-amino-4, 6-dideoxy-N-acetyl-beta-L-altrosamine N-acetyltransferase n=1 Tax=Cognatiyoonia sp. IB215446 TaxID=3097355 RepID=UPI002A138356|nr:UDP-4-amino-4,6-dideoxy-N-acetyl-beta-L-altrosamine N-acetyltransferase [Cognatiyoonia sp. IB215446]MDX8349287.1 UDP-4-amino-4,6-dideoxy-N-acetyl-beta-L-altrosamine N-acetyltransferase [Cognatiyoonia sp. IB215446]
MTPDDGILRPISILDADLTRKWRNQDAVRHFMFNTAVVQANDHQNWLQGVINDPERFYYVYEENSAAIGLVGLIFTDLDAGEADWSFYKGAAHARRGAGFRMLRVALTQFFSQLEGKRLRGEVLEDNIASRILHQKLGFEMVEPSSRTVLHRGTQKQVFHFRLHRSAWHA